jgi:hypothetical protein
MVHPAVAADHAASILQSAFTGVMIVVTYFGLAMLPVSCFSGG